MANAGLIVAGSRILASVMAQIAPQAVIKGADQSLASSTTMQNDNALFAAVIANATYLFLCYLDYEGGTQGSSDLKWQWNVPAGGTLRYAEIGNNLSGVVQSPSLAGSTVWSAGTSGAGSLRGVLMAGSLIMSSTAGNIQLQWAQNTSNATPTIVHAQSFLALWRIT